MKKLFILLGFLAFCLSAGNAQTDYRQWECGYVKAKTGQTEMFEKGLTAHNRKFHNADPYKVYVFNVLTGPNSGKYFVALGPVTFTQIEGRPASDEHGMDWAKNVMPYIEEEGETYYWREDKDLQYRAPNSDNFTRSRFRNTTLLPDGKERFEGLMKQVVEVVTAKAYPVSFFTYWKWGASTGPHVITELNMEHWSFFDGPGSFKADFDEVHGEGAYARFVDEFELCVDRSKTFDEMVEFKPNLSSQ